MARKKRVAFWATKTVTKPERVEFVNQYGELVSFKAVKRRKKPIKIVFYERGR
jgi:hypothetical protein